MTVVYKFASSTRTGLFAFAGDQVGSKLPERHGPWTLTGNIQPDEQFPHKISRSSVEEAIDDPGFQMWRLKGEG